MSIDNEFLVQASSDGQNWTTVLRETEQDHDGQNKADRNIDIAPFFPQSGWGGRVSHVKVTVN
jgi:hypothetical protein